MSCSLSTLFIDPLLRDGSNIYLTMQMGKDVVSFLSWAAEPEMEERKLVSCNLSFGPSPALCQSLNGV